MGSAVPPVPDCSGSCPRRSLLLIVNGFVTLNMHDIIDTPNLSRNFVGTAYESDRLRHLRKSALKEQCQPL